MRRCDTLALGSCRGNGWFVGVLCAALVGCGGHERGSAGRAPDPAILSSSDVHILGTSDALAEVKDLEVLPDGSVWVLNSLDPFFLGFSGDGSLLSAYGTLGGGPREFGGPAAFVTGSVEGEAWILDSRRHSLVEVSEPESAWRSIPLPRDSLPPGSLLTGLDLMDSVVRTARMGDEILLARTTRPEGSDFFGFRIAMLEADIMALDPEAGSVRRILSLADVLGDLAHAIELTEGGLPLWYRLWAVCGEDRLCVYDRIHNQIRSFDGMGEEQGATLLPPVAFSEVSPRQFAKAFFRLRQAEIAGDVRGRMNPADSVRLMKEMIQGVRGTPAQLAQYLPRYVDFRCADDGTFWLQPFDVDTGALPGGPAWIRINGSGVAQEVRFPDGFDPFRFTGNRVWGVQRNDLDVASVAWVELPRQQ